MSTTWLTNIDCGWLGGPFNMFELITYLAPFNATLARNQLLN